MFQFTPPPFLHNARYCETVGQLHRQNGHFSKAVPLYERALNIVKSVHGLRFGGLFCNKRNNILHYKSRKQINTYVKESDIKCGNAFNLTSCKSRGHPHTIMVSVLVLYALFPFPPKASLRFGKTRGNIDSFRGFIDKQSFFEPKWSLISPPPLPPGSTSASTAASYFELAELYNEKTDLVAAVEAGMKVVGGGGVFLCYWGVYGGSFMVYSFNTIYT